MDTCNPKFLFNGATPASAEPISLIGYVIEPQGKTVSQQDDHVYSGA